MRPAALDAPTAKAGNLVFASGQIASVDGSGVAPQARIDPAFPYYGSSIKRQTRFILDKLSKIFEAAGLAHDGGAAGRMQLEGLGEVEAGADE